MIMKKSIYEEADEEKITPRLGTLYDMYKYYKFLYFFWINHRDEERMVTNEDMRNRIKFILKNKCNQREEISTICWILGEPDVREIDN